MDNIKNSNRARETADMDDPVILSPQKSRQGRLGRPVAVVLIVSLLLATLSWIGLGVFGEYADNSATIMEPEPASNSTK